MWLLGGRRYREHRALDHTNAKQTRNARHIASLRAADPKTRTADGHSFTVRDRGTPARCRSQQSHVRQRWATPPGDAEPSAGRTLPPRWRNRDVRRFRSPMIARHDGSGWRPRGAGSGRRQASETISRQHVTAWNVRVSASNSCSGMLPTNFWARRALARMSNRASRVRSEGMGAQGCDDVFAIHEGCRKRNPVARPEFPGFAMPRRILSMRDTSQSPG